MSESETSVENPLIGPIRSALEAKRNSMGVVPKSWLLVLLCILDRVRDSETPLLDDDLYSYDYTLKGSRASAIPRIEEKYKLPRLGLGREGITTRGAPGLRLFHAIEGGRVIMDRPREERVKLIDEAVELVRAEVLKMLSQVPVELPSHQFEQAGTFAAALLDATKNLSHGRVEQALVGAKLQLRFPHDDVPLNPVYAADRQTGRECDYEVGNIRVIVSVTPKDQHFESAGLLANEGRQVYLIVTDESVKRAKATIRKAGYAGKVLVLTVEDYVASNVTELSKDLKVSGREMCIKLATEYNRRAGVEGDRSLQVVLPK